MILDQAVVPIFYSWLCNFNIEIVFISERHGLVEPKKVELLESKILTALRDHVTHNTEAKKKPQYLSRILDKLPLLRSLSQQAMQRIFYLRLVGLVPEPPILEKLFSSNIPFWAGRAGGWLCL